MNYYVSPNLAVNRIAPTLQADEDSDSVERLVEVFQGDEWSGGVASPSEMIELYGVTCSARKCGMLPVDEAAILAVRLAIASLTQRWQAVPVGGALELEL